MMSKDLKGQLPLLKVVRSIPTQHEDHVHYVSFGFYGLRMATCSSDHTIRVWDKDPKQDKWSLNEELKEKGHTGAVFKVVWGHPEFGQVLASCSFDRSVIIWEEQPGGKPNWLRRVALVDSRDSVKDIEFAPKHLGFKLATCSADGVVRIYEAIDIMNLTHWPLIEEFESKKSSCISWCQSRYTGPMLAVGSSSPKIKIWGYNDNSRSWQEVETLTGHNDVVNNVAFAPDVGRSYHLLASCSNDLTLRLWKLTEKPNVTSFSNKHNIECIAILRNEASVRRVDWNLTGTVLATSADDGTVRLWKEKGKWVCISKIKSNGEVDTNFTSKG